MSWVFSVLVVCAPLFSWADSLYLDAPRLGMIDEFASSGRNCHFIYTDIAVFEQNSASRWRIGLRSIPLSEQPRIDGVVKGASVEEAESDELKPDKRYWIGGHLYEAQQYKGPWNEIERILAGLAPSFTVDVEDSPQGAGAQAVYGTLYCGERLLFRSASGTYQIEAPAAAAGVQEYLGQLAASRSASVDDLEVNGILYLQGEFPLFLYVLEGS
jgi:hypothetical protein